MKTRPVWGGSPQTRDVTALFARGVGVAESGSRAGAALGGSQGVASWAAPPAALIAGAALLAMLLFQSHPPTAAPIEPDPVPVAHTAAAPKSDLPAGPRQDVGEPGAIAVEVDRERQMLLQFYADIKPSSQADGEPTPETSRRKLRIPDYETTCGLDQAGLSSWGAGSDGSPRVLQLEPAIEAVASRGDRNAPRLAIVIDDGGYGGWPTEQILTMDSRLTLSILPFAPHSRSTAERAIDLGFEVMLHMPMESYYTSHNCTGFLGVGMDQAEIMRRLEAALGEVPGAIGINNHTGGRFTRDAAAMARVMVAIRDRGLFFLDSRVVSRSKGYDVALANGIPALSNSIFLDHYNDVGSIRRHFYQLLELAKKRGSAIGIGHFRPNTALVLKQLLPEVEAHGVRLVHASELLHQEEAPTPDRPSPWDLPRIADRVEGGAELEPAAYVANELPQHDAVAHAGAG